VLSSKTIRVALSSQDPKLQPLLAPALGRDVSVLAESNPLRLKDLLWQRAADVLLLDLDSTFSNPAQQVRFYESVKEAGVSVIAMTDDVSRPLAVDLVQDGVHGYCRKPPALRELKAMIQRASEYATMKRELERRNAPPQSDTNQQPPANCDGLIGSSSELRSVYELIHRVANLNASVLITGESGTGKELIARAIHNLGNRSRYPFIAVSCGAIPETLIESELFGHEKGAFTGTNGTRTGYFEQAADGTLLIDEIGELSQQTQVKLLRVLQQREFTRLGSGRAIPLRARVLFATHRDLLRMVSEGSFRLDLYYRINVMTIKAPALADRPGDIAVLAQHFIKHYSELYEKSVVGMTPAALAMLEEYDWPGNVRELENVIQSAIICTDSQLLEPRDLGDRFKQADIVEREDIPQIGTFERLLREFKLKVATKAIEDCNGNKTLAARSLDISRAYLHRLIRVSDQSDTSNVA
jgi:DNA-binding NtrC family response regulator